ncbi:MAG TPA: DUF3014 domain-containing protein [Burkholderiaceae bacterium]|nr:DUF3014 domain-containing protein [Burkholderiaceae bacterium]
MERLIEKPAVWWVLIIAAAGGLGGWYYWLQRQPAPAPVAVAPPAPPAAPAAEAPPPAAAPAEAPIQHPIEVPPAAAALPGLDQSDAAIAEALGGVFGAHALHGFLKPDQVIHRIVATLDNLPRARAVVDTWPVRPVGGRFVVAQNGDATYVGAENAARYATYAKIASTLDTGKLVAAYIRFYPLFQQAYRDLGYPHGYFNDRLVEVLDDLLAAPDVVPPVALVAPHAMFEYADPQLEARSAGQKIMMRIGGANEAMVKQKLREIRGAVAKEKPAG